MRHELGEKCTNDRPTGNDNDPDAQKGQTVADLYNVLFKFDSNHPEEAESAIMKVIFGKTWPALF